MRHRRGGKEAKLKRAAELLASGVNPAAMYSELHPKCKNPDRLVGRFLKNYPQIEQMAHEMLNRRVDTKTVIVSRAEELASVNKAYVLTNLKEIVERCMQAKPVMDSEGNVTYVETPSGEIAPQFGFDPKNATRALHLLGMEIGMFTIKVRHVTDPFDGMSLDDVKAILAALDEIRNGRVIPHEVAGAPRLDHGAQS